MSDTDNENGDSVDKAFDLAGWCASLRITDAGLKKIEANAVSDLGTLLLFRDQDIELLKLAAGDALRFRLGLQKLRAASDVPPPLFEQNPFPVKKDSLSSVPTSERVYSQLEVQQLLAGKPAVQSGQEGAGAVSRTGL